MSEALSPESFDLGQFIPLHYHHVMLMDGARTAAFREAIETLVRSGDKVVDLGGGTGILSFLAARRASRVWYVERNPELYRFAGRVLPLNAGAEKIELVAADASTFLPPERVDVVLCEMLHAGMLREKQLNVLSAFKKNYLARFGPPLPRFIPEAALLAVQPVQHPFEFCGYHCPIPVFQDPLSPGAATVGLADPVAYATIDYAKEFPLVLRWEGVIPISAGGTLTALRFITKNIIGILVDERRSIDWHSAYLVMPVPTPHPVQPGAEVRISFSYPAGAPLDALAASLRVESSGPAAPVPVIRVQRGTKVRPG